MRSVSKAMALVKSKVVKTKEPAKKAAKNPMAELTKQGKSFRDRSKWPKKKAHKEADKVEKVTEKPVKKAASITEKRPEPKAAEKIANAENHSPPPSPSKVSPKISALNTVNKGASDRKD